MALMIFENDQEAAEAVDACVDEAQGILRDGVSFPMQQKPNMTRLSAQQIECLDDNVLPLSKVDFECEGKVLYKDTHVCAIWHRNFYNLPEGTPFAADYRFTVGVVPEGRIYAAIEGAENLDSITMNGVPVQAMRTRGEACVMNEKAWLDVSFTRVEITGYIQPGENCLRIEGKKINNVIGVGSHVGVSDFEHYFPTELDTVYIVGQFRVDNLDHTSFCLTKKQGQPDSKNVQADGYPFYAGKVSYRYRCTVPDKPSVLLYLSKYSGTTARCFVDGQCIGIAGVSPYVFNLSGYAGKTIDMEVRVANDLYNLMGPTYIRDLKSFPWVNPGIFNDTGLYTERLSLNPFGIEDVYLLS